MMLRILAAPSNAVGWNEIKSKKKYAQNSRIHAVRTLSDGSFRAICHRSPLRMDEPEEMFVQDFVNHKYACQLCTHELLDISCECEICTQHLNDG